MNEEYMALATEEPTEEPMALETEEPMTLETEEPMTYLVTNE